MRKILIATHGHLAKGFESAVNLICGEHLGVSYFNAFVDDTNIDDFINNYMNDIGDNDVAVICTDILGGSVNQKFLPYLNRENIYLISGINLPLILELVLYSEDINVATLNALIEQSKEVLLLVNECTFQYESTEEDFF